MPLIYIRHSDEESSDYTHRHDKKLTPYGQHLADKKGKKIIEKYGQPDIIFCSPFRRTKQTVEMIKPYLNHPKIYYTTGLSRYFSERERRNTRLAPSTLKMEIPIHESYRDFSRRITDFVMDMDKYINSDQVVWCVTHASVYKYISKIYSIELPDYIPFMHDFKIKSRKWCQECRKYHKRSHF